MKDNSKFLNNVINTISDPVFVKNEDHILILVNDAYSDFLGIKKDEVIGKDDYSFFPKEQVEIFWNRDQEALISGKTNINEEKITNKQNETRTIMTVKSVFKNGNGKKYIVGVIRDMDDFKRARDIDEKHAQELEELNNIMLKREVRMSEIKKEIADLKIRFERCNT